MAERPNNGAVGKIEGLLYAGLHNAPSEDGSCRCDLCITYTDQEYKREENGDR